MLVGLYTFLMHVTVTIELFAPLVRRKAIPLSNRKVYPRHLRNKLNRKALLWKKRRISNHIQNKQAYKEYSIKCSDIIPAE